MDSRQHLIHSLDGVEIPDTCNPAYARQHLYSCELYATTSKWPIVLRLRTIFVVACLLQDRPFGETFEAICEGELFSTYLIYLSESSLKQIVAGKYSLMTWNEPVRIQRDFPTMILSQV